MGVFREAGKLLRADTGGGRRRCVGPDHAYGEEDIQNAEAADRAAKRRMEQNSHKRREMTQEIILFPNASPGKIKEDRAHNAAEHDQQRAENPIHA